MFTSAAEDSKGDRRPFSRDWQTESVSFEPVDGRDRIVLRFTHATGFEISVELSARDFPSVSDGVSASPNLSGLAYEITMLIEAEVFTRSPEEFEVHAVVVGPRGILNGLKTVSLKELLESQGVDDWRLG